MNQFQLTYYRLTHDKEKNEFEELFKEIKNQIDIFERQFKLTVKSYLKEWEGEVKLLDTAYSESKKNAEKVYKDILGDNPNDENAHQYAMHVSGLENLDYHHYEEKEKIEHEYLNFLDLFSKSILIALYSLNETKLNEITNIASNIFNKKIKPSHFNSRDYLNSSFQYLNLVIELETEAIQKHISKLKDIQLLRNSIVHNGSVITDRKMITVISKKNKEYLSISESGFFKIKTSKFIEGFFTLLREFYEALFWLIDAKQNFKIIKTGLLYWLGIIDKDISIEEFRFDNFLKNEKKICFLAQPKDLSLAKFKCKLTLKETINSSITAIIDIDNEKIKKFFQQEEKSNGYYLLDVFNVFNINEKKYSINIMIF